MSVKNLITNYTNFNEWANNRIITWLQGIDKNLLFKETPSSFNTIDATLQHILRAQKLWLLFISGNDIKSNTDWSIKYNELEIMLQSLQEVSVQMKEKFSSFSTEELEEVLNFDMPWAKNSKPRYEYIFHIINHSSFHRGQIITMARCLGITENIPNTDYNIYNSL